MKKDVHQLWLKIALTAMLLGAGAAYVGTQLFPGLPLARAALYVAGSVAALLLVLLVVALAGLVVRQFVLRKGGTDTQWFWFASEPRGLLQLRAEAQAVRDERERLRG